MPCADAGLDCISQLLISRLPRYFTHVTLARRQHDQSVFNILIFAE